MPFQGPDQARQEARRALDQTFLDSLKLGGGAWVAFATVVAAFLGVYAMQGWLKQGTLLACVIILALALPAVVVAFELRRLAACRRELRNVLSAEIAYDDVLREARQERDEAKNELQLQYAQNELRVTQLRTYYTHEIANAVAAKGKPE